MDHGFLFALAYACMAMFGFIESLRWSSCIPTFRGSHDCSWGVQERGGVVTVCVATHVAVLSRIEDNRPPTAAMLRTKGFGGCARSNPPNKVVMKVQDSPEFRGALRVERECGHDASLDLAHAEPLVDSIVVTGRRCFRVGAWSIVRVGRATRRNWFRIASCDVLGDGRRGCCRARDGRGSVAGGLRRLLNLHCGGLLCIVRG